jgi:hypothetical protein
MLTCSSCNGFLPQDFATCPHCDAPAPAPRASGLEKLAAKAAAIASGVAVSMTLMACYGLPPCNDDQDNDGYCPSIGTDCNDANPNIHDYANDPVGDGIDQNCDGVDGEANPPDAGDAGVDDCVKCSAMLSFPDFDPATACTGSLRLHAAVLDCACEEACAEHCSANLCSEDGNASTACEICLEGSCASANQACMND